MTRAGAASAGEEIMSADADWFPTDSSLVEALKLISMAKDMVTPGVLSSCLLVS